jgi:hypothetical protein
MTQTTPIRDGLDDRTEPAPKFRIEHSVSTLFSSGSARVTSEEAVTCESLKAEVTTWERHDGEEYISAAVNAPAAALVAFEGSKDPGGGFLSLSVHEVTSVEVEPDRYPGAPFTVKVVYNNGRVGRLTLFAADDVVLNLEAGDES